LPEAIAGKVKAGTQMTVQSEAAGDLNAEVTELAPNADPSSRTLQAKLDLPAGRGLITGQFARLKVPIGEISSLRVPSSAVLQRGQMEIVFTVENQRARLHLVKTGGQAREETELLSGLNPGESVVFDNANQLMDGQAVKLQ
jgi:hypothetical protein